MDKKLTIFEFLSNQGSSTKLFKSWTNNIKIEVLSQYTSCNIHHRIIVMVVDDMPVLIGHSTTEIQNTIFLKILQEAQSTPIGIKLFKPKSNIKRINLKINKINFQEIPNQAIVTYISLLKLAEPSIYYRQSDFITGIQKMQLVEYALPDLKTLLKSKLKNG